MLKESFDPSVDEQERGCWSGMGLGAGREGAGGRRREGAQSGQGEQAGKGPGAGREQEGRELEVGRGKGPGAGFLCQPFLVITQDLLQKMVRVFWLMQLSSWCAGKGYKEVRLRFSWMWEFLLFLPCAQSS